MRPPCSKSTVQTVGLTSGRSPMARGLEENRAARRKVALADPKALHGSPVEFRRCEAGRRSLDVAGLFAVEDARATSAAERAGVSRFVVEAGYRHPSRLYSQA